MILLEPPEEENEKLNPSIRHAGVFARREDESEPLRYCQSLQKVAILTHWPQLTQS